MRPAFDVPSAGAALYRRDLSGNQLAGVLGIPLAAAAPATNGSRPPYHLLVAPGNAQLCSTPGEAPGEGPGASRGAGRACVGRAAAAAASYWGWHMWAPSVYHGGLSTLISGDLGNGSLIQWRHELQVKLQRQQGWTPPSCADVALDLPACSAAQLAAAAAAAASVASTHQDLASRDACRRKP